jgi:hypothetical protein
VHQAPEDTARRGAKHRRWNHEPVSVVRALFLPEK